MRENMEEIILKELFKLSDKVDKMATKEDLKREIERCATKEDLKREIEKCATKKEMNKKFEEMKKVMVTKEELKKEFEEQGKEIATILRDTFKTSSKIHNEMETRLINKIDNKIKDLKSQLKCMKI